MYRKSIDILENYLNNICNISKETFYNIGKVINRIKKNDDCRNIRRDYSLILDYVKKICKLCELSVYRQIEEIRNYFSLVEKNLLKFSRVIIECIWLCSNGFSLPENKSIENYKNYQMHLKFDKALRKIQLHFENLNFYLLQIITY